MSEVKNLLYENIDRMGGKIKIVPVSILSQVQNEWVICLEQLEGTDMYHAMLHNYFDFSLPAEIKSLIIIALPSPPCYVEFEWGSQSFEADIPPAYSYRDQQLTMMKELVRKVFEPYQLKSWPVVLPKKILAAMSGFGKYGRNNLMYIEGMGSCHRLTVFGSDMLCTDEITPTPDLRMERCSRCVLCSKQCPTGAIDRSKERIDADQCLAFFNERNVELPQWIHKNWHNSLVGCTRCQEQCPANRGLWNRMKIAHFSHEETQMILENSIFEALDGALQNKLTELSLDRYFDVLSRNIKLLVKANPNIKLADE